MGYAVIADFGLAKVISKDVDNTSDVCTIWYRAPEALMVFK